MKKSLIYLCHIFLFGSCGSNSNSENEQNKKATISQEKKKNNTSETAIITPVKEKGCDASDVDVYINDSDDSGINIRKSPNGEVVLKLTKTEDDEFFLKLIERQDGWFKIKGPIGGMESDIEIPSNEGWIHGSVIAVNTRNYGNQDLELLDNPKNGNLVGVIKEESHGLRLKDLCGSWVQVEYNGTIGWIESSWLCGNPLTTCS